MIGVPMTTFRLGALGFVAIALTVSARGAFVQAQEIDYRALYQEGRSYADFHADAKARRELWDQNTARALVAPDVLTRARAVGGTWKLLAVAIDGCSDSVSTLPYIAKLVEQVPGLELRIIPPEKGKAIQEAHRNPDGNAVTPTIILLDESFKEVGAFIERPPSLISWYAQKKKELEREALTKQKMEWYDRDAGASTLQEIVRLMESAKR